MRGWLEKDGGDASLASDRHSNMRERLPEVGGLRVSPHPNMSQTCRDWGTAGTACLLGSLRQCPRRKTGRSWGAQTLWTPKMSQ